MAIWAEILVLALVTYAIGIGIGWALWGRQIDESVMEQEGPEE